MKTYCVKCRKDTEKLNSKIFKTKITDKLCNHNVCGNKKSRFVKQQEPKGLLSNLGIKTPLCKNSIVKCFILRRIKMNEIMNKFLLVGDKFTPELHLKQP